MVVTITTQPAVNISVGGMEESKARSNISIFIKGMSERNSNGVIISNVDFDDSTFELFLEDTSSKVVWEYISILENRASVKATISFLFTFFSLLVFDFDGLIVYSF